MQGGFRGDLPRREEGSLTHVNKPKKKEEEGLVDFGVNNEAGGGAG